MRVRVSLDGIGCEVDARAILERLPEGDEDDENLYARSEGQRILDDLAADDDGGDAE